MKRIALHKKHHTEIQGNRLHFLGAAREVTGSCHLLELNGFRLLLDCGLLQGHDSKKHPVERPFAFRPADIDAVILSHAHLDHSGMLPRLVHEGFNGPIYCTAATRNLLRILLMDAFHLYCKEIEYENKRRERAGRKPLTISYDEQDVHKVLKQCETCNYEHTVDIGNGIRFTLQDAGHILGSSIVVLEFPASQDRHHHPSPSHRDEHGKIIQKKTEIAEMTTLVFSGDLGNSNTALMHDPATITEADIVLMESTYGDRDHRDPLSSMAEFIEILRKAEQEHGNILIPAFAVGRTQELIFQLGKLYHQGELQNWQVFLDSPMAREVTDIYSHNLARLAEEDTALLEKYHSSTLTEFLPCLHVTESPEDSMAINKIRNGAIIIAGSGMCTGGRIRHHLKHRLWQHNTHIIFTGFQAQGTLGRILIQKPATVRIYGEVIAIKAQMHTLGGFSAHAGQSQLLNWAQRFRNTPQFYLVHGEDEALTTLQQCMQARDLTVAIAEPMQTIEI